MAGTDATIAQHIQTIIDRKYVMERMQGATKYLIPSTLGIGLVEGYNAIEFDRSLSKPQFRREVCCVESHAEITFRILIPSILLTQTERRMVDVCEGRKTMADMLQESIEQYREMYHRTKNDFARIVHVRSPLLRSNDFTQLKFSPSVSLIDYREGHLVMMIIWTTMMVRTAEAVTRMAVVPVLEEMVVVEEEALAVVVVAVVVAVAVDQLVAEAALGVLEGAQAPLEEAVKEDLPLLLPPLLPHLLVPADLRPHHQGITMEMTATYVSYIHRSLCPI